MSRTAVLPYDIRQECLWIVRGYDRRVKAYHAARREIIEGTPCRFKDKRNGDRVFLPSGGENGRPAEDKAGQLEGVEEWPETLKMRAVEQARLHIGTDLGTDEMRQRLSEGIILNCSDGRQYPYRYLNLPDISETNFYYRRDRFLLDIAKFMHYI